MVTEFLEWIHTSFLPRCRDERGGYGRRPGRGTNHAYGTSEAVNLAHTLGVELPDRAGLAGAFAALQDPHTGSFVENPATHHPVHATAYNRAAMALVDLEPTVPIRLVDDMLQSATPDAFLGRLDWRDDVYLGSHEGAGVGSLVALEHRPGSDEWLDAYIAALETRLDPRNGMFGVDKPMSGDSDQIGGTFHYAFLYEHLGSALPHPEARIDAVLGLRQADGWWHPENHLWLTLDAIYLLTRAASLTDHRRSEIETTVEQTHGLMLSTYATAEGRRHFEQWFLGAHDLTAVASFLAEVQSFTQGALAPSRRHWPLRLVLDDRPFI